VATYEAMVKCEDAVSLESCRDRPAITTAQREARKAVSSMLNLRLRFVKLCQEGDSFDNCVDRATYYMIGGFNKAMSE
jgi:hypothetical protein